MTPPQNRALPQPNIHNGTPAADYPNPPNAVLLGWLVSIAFLLIVRMPRDDDSISQRQTTPHHVVSIKSRRISSTTRGRRPVKTTKFLLLIVPHPRDSPSAAAMLRHLKTPPKPFKFRNPHHLSKTKSTSAPVHSRQFDMRVKLGPPPPCDTPCPPEKRLHKPFHSPKLLPRKISACTPTSRQSEMCVTTHPRFPGCKRQSYKPICRGKRLLFPSTLTPEKEVFSSQRRPGGNWKLN